MPFSTDTLFLLAIATAGVVTVVRGVAASLKRPVDGPFAVFVVALHGAAVASLLFAKGLSYSAHAELSLAAALLAMGGFSSLDRTGVRAVVAKAPELSALLQGMAGGPLPGILAGAVGALDPKLSGGVTPQAVSADISAAAKELATVARALSAVLSAPDTLPAEAALAKVLRLADAREPASSLGLGGSPPNIAPPPPPAPQPPPAA